MISPARYNLFGLIADSCIDLPLPRTESEKDVRIIRGPVPAHGVVLFESADPPFVCCFSRDGDIVLQWEGIRFGVSPDRVVVDTDHVESATHLLVPAVWSVVLAAHGRESLHGSSVSKNGSSIAILGHSGSGKSTAARKLIEQGWQLLSDDLLTFDSDLHVVPGPPWLRLLEDPGALSLKHPDAGGKWRTWSAMSEDHVPLSTIVVMQPEYRQCVRLTGTSAASALLQHVYFPVLTHPGQARRRFDLVSALAHRVPIYGAPPRSLEPDLLENIAQGK